jgi:hypothetical protein
MSQKQPWEEEWSRHPSQADEWIVRDGEVIIATMTDPVRRQLAEAAPDMARCLRSVLTEAMADPRLRAMLGDELVDEMRRALHRAGAMQ